MKTPRTSIITNAIAVCTVCAFLNLPALAGGPGWLHLPVDGLTEENREACVKLVREKLKASIMPSSSPSHQVNVKDGFVHMPLGSKPVSLADFEAALKGSAFKIPMDELVFDRVVRFKIDRADSLEDLSADLSVSPDIHVSTRKLDQGEISILVQDRRGRRKALLAYRDLKRIIADHGAKLIDVTWGADPETFGREDYFHWVCGAPCGALRLTEVKAPAAKATTKANSESAAGKSGAIVKKKAG